MKLKSVIMFEKWCARSEYDVKTFTNPVEAVEYINHNEVDACFIDYRCIFRNPLTVHSSETRAKLSSDLPIWSIALTAVPNAVTNKEEFGSTINQNEQASYASVNEFEELLGAPKVKERERTSD